MSLRNTYWRLMKKIRPVAYLRHKSDETWDLFESDIENAGTNEERRQQESMRDFECSEYLDEIRHIESQKWIARAENVHLSVYDIALLNDHEKHWDTGPHGSRYLADRVFRTLKKQVEDAEYERNRRKRESRELWIKYITAGAALLAAAASITNLIVTTHKK
jgi:hypothetical protein